MIKDHNAVDFELLLWISNDEHAVDLSSAMIDLSSARTTITSIIQELDGFSIPLVWTKML